jgi:hypothetical protein
MPASLIVIAREASIALGLASVWSHLINFMLPVESFMQGGFEEAVAFGLGGGEMRFQPITQRHQFTNLGDDAVLFGEWWEGHGAKPNIFKIERMDGSCS